ncbi:MAG: TatD family hydrolase [Firmicutes bacterium]|nr:TatD family hydrolase [Bacillota bacterium]
MLIDTHAHLTDARLNHKQILADMQADGLSRIITVGYNKETSLNGYAIAQTDERVFCSLGFHPSNTGEAASADYDAFLKLAACKKVVAIGETGLDYHYDNTDKSMQAQHFIRQLELAQAADLPVIIHLRDAHEDLHRILAQHAHQLTRHGVMHCFSGSAETLKQYTDLGFYISFSGCITFSNAKKYPDIIKACPIERLLIETDCPYLSPEPFRGQTNYPKNVRYTAQKIADVLNLPLDEIAQITSRNAHSLFYKLC